MTTNRSYSELCKLESFEERLAYLQTKSSVGSDTFGSKRYLNQRLYTSEEWKRVRRAVILRDDGCDLGLKDYPIMGRCYIHHLNPITEDDILNRSPVIFDPDNLICTSFDTHQQIHYGMEVPARNPTERKPDDTCPWKKRGDVIG